MVPYLTPEIEQNSKKSLFVLENIFSGTKLYPLCISMIFKQNKKIHMFNFSRHLISETAAATPWWIDFA